MLEISYKKFQNNPCADSSKQMIYVLVEFASRHFSRCKNEHIFFFEPNPGKGRIMESM